MRDGGRDRGGGEPSTTASNATRASNESARRSVSLTVVIPVLDEEGRVRDAVMSARASARARVVVVDGGSRDDTVRVARSSGATVLKSARGRGRQMNAGATATTRRGGDGDDDVLVFLHADSTLPKGYDEVIERELNDQTSRKSREWGAFAFKMSEEEGEGFGRALTKRAIEFGTNARCRLFGMPYGDQALVIRRQTFDSVGGFDELPFMEDYIMAEKLRRRGSPVLFRAPVKTSGRRWDERGLFKVTLMNQVIVAAYKLGVPVSKLAEWYKKT